MKYLSLFFLLTLLIGCKTYNEDDKKSFDEQIKSYLEKKNVKCKRNSSGLYYKILEPGTGDFIKFTDVVSFKYKGYFMNGTVFDEQAKKPVEYEVGQLIGAWKEIMLLLKPGGKAFLVAPPSLGYGDRDLEDIPPHSILVFEMEVVSVK